MTDEMKKTKEEFDLLLQEASLKDYLKADPQQAGEKTKLSRVMTNDFFFKFFYWDNKMVDNRIEEYRYNIKANFKRNIVLHGYEGCGKSTFINYWMKKDGNRHVVLEFDKYIKTGDELRATIVGSIYKTLSDDVYRNNALVIRKILEMFASEQNIHCMAANDLKNNFIYMFDKFRYVLKLMKEQKTYDLSHFLVQHIKQFMVENYDISELILFIVIWDICYKKIYNESEQCYIVFENLDTLYESFGLQELVSAIGIFRNNAENLFRELKENGKEICNPTEEYICIFVMRDTTKAVFNEHINSQKVSLFIPDESLTFNYRIDKVIEKKAEYLENLKREAPESFCGNCIELLAGIRRIQEVLKDEYVTDTIFTLFNNNFRKEFEVLADTHITEENIFNKYKKLRKIDMEKRGQYNWPAYASRCILFREIFDILNKEGFFITLRRSDYEKIVKNKKYAINLSRLILLYLQNVNNKGLLPKADGNEWEFISLETLAKDMLLICDDNIKIAQALWEMFEFRTKNNWNHLITFDQLKGISKAAILEQMKAAKTEEYSNTEFGKIRITLAGATYVEKVLTHFEYFAARNDKTDLPSLFTWGINDIFSLEKLDKYLALEKEEVTQCCKRLLCFNEEVISNLSDFSGNNFLKSKFVHRKYYEEGNYRGMYHCERIVHSQITYMDAFRMHVFYEIDHSRIGLFDGINITKLITLFLAKIRSYGRLSEDRQNMINKLKNAKERVLICKKGNVKIKCIFGGNTSAIEIGLSELELKKLLKTIMNVKIITDIQEYISMFGIKDPSKRCTATSEDTIYLAGCYDACIEAIEQSNYETFDLEINQSNGKKIMDII